MVLLSWTGWHYSPPIGTSCQVKYARYKKFFLSSWCNDIHYAFVYFTGLIIVTDCFHGAKAHDTCPASFQIKYWHSNIEACEWTKMHSINTSTAKQLNAKLHFLEKHICCAKFSNAIAWTKKFCEIHNMLVTGLLSKAYLEHN